MFCCVENCNNTLYSSGYCCAHYKRLKLYGRLEKKPLGTKTKHPLFAIWNKRKNKEFVKEWLDFDVFLKDVGEKPKDTYLARLDLTKPCGPNNFIWKTIFKPIENETDEDRRKRQRRENLKLNPTYSREQNYKYVYGITLEQYNEMLKAQNFVCAICEQSETATYKGTDKIKNLAIDHCHKTGKLRKLLCSKCNLFIGKLEESLHLLDKMKVYLNEHS